MPDSGKDSEFHNIPNKSRNMEMDDNENLIDFQKMNFSPFTQFAGLQANPSLHQFTTAKFAQNLTAANGQMLGMIGDGGVQFIRSMDGSTTGVFNPIAHNPSQSPGNNNNNTSNNNNNPNSPNHQMHHLHHQMQQSQTLILPITMPGDKPGDAQQTVQIQVLNPNQIQQSPKFHMGSMQIPIQMSGGFQQPTVVTVAVPQDGEIMPNHGLPEGVTVVTALQPQDLQMFAQSPHLQQQMQQQQHQQHIMAMQQQHHQQQQQQQLQQQQQMQIQSGDAKTSDEERDIQTVTIKQEPIWNHVPTMNPQQAELAEYFQRQGISLNLQQFLKFNPDTIKREAQIENSPLNTASESADITMESRAGPGSGTSPTNTSLNSSGGGATSTTTTTPTKPDGTGKVKKKRKYKKKPPKPKAEKPGQVHIATALDGTILFCCPQCQMAYPDKSNLEVHLMVHKIERRHICDICGAGLKRKEHLERHKLGHSPERPYICSVCMKGFKRKEHLNLHFVIHSGDKNEICGECGKGFYRKDHLRKHAKSHISKRIKEERSALVAQAAAMNSADMAAAASASASTTTAGLNSLTYKPGTLSEGQTICLPAGVTIHVPTSNNTTLPVQISLPHMVTTSAPDGTTSTVVLQSPPPASHMHHQESLHQHLQMQQQQLQQHIQQ